MAQLIKITLVFNNAGRGVASNSFVYENAALVPSDAQTLLDSEAWIQDIYTPLRPFMSNQYQFMNGQVDEISYTTGKVIRHIGNISPSISGSSTGEMLPTIDAGSALARTNVPKVRGSKRFGGFTEGTQVNGLFQNPVLAALASAAAEWLAGAALDAIDSPGVWSKKVLDFVPFANSGAVTNIPGSQVTRKPGRGA